MHGYDLKNAGLILALSISPGGTTPQILYLDGRRIALGTDLEPEVLAESLQAGQSYTVAVKVLATNDDKSITAPGLWIRFAASRPNPTHLREECMGAAVLLPTLDHNPKELAEDLAVVEKAIAEIDTAALDQGRQEAFDASLRTADKTLSMLRPKLQTLTVDAVGHSHIDAAWRWPWTETVDVVKNTFGTALQLMTEYPGYRYAQSDVQYDAFLEKKYPALFDGIKARVNDGRWDLVGGMWAEPDLNEPDGETMVRQLLIGKRYMLEHFGKDTRIGWNVDSFGYSWQLPQIYKKSGVDFFVTQKLNWNETNRLPLKLFWWQSPDGSSVLTYFPMSYNGTTDPLEMAKELANDRPFAPGLNEVMHIYGVGDHGGGPTRIQLDSAHQWIASDPVAPRVVMSSPDEFFASVAKKVSSPEQSPVWNYKTFAAHETQLPAARGDGISVPVWNDELYLETHRGTYTTQATLKQSMRNSEEWLLDAEKLSSISWVLGSNAYPQSDLNEAWKKALFNTNHDLAAGSGVGVIYADAQTDYDAVHATTQTAAEQATGWIAEHADTRVDDPKHESSLIVFNTLAWPRDGLLTATVQLPSLDAKGGIRVRDAVGHSVPVQVISADPTTASYKLLLKLSQVPAMGYEVLHVSNGPGDAPGDLQVNGTALENSLLRVVIDPLTGCITHLISRSSGFDSIADGGCGNQLQTFVDEPKKYDAWNIDADALDKMAPIQDVDSIQVVDRGPLRASVQIVRHWGHSHFVQTIVLYADIGRVDIENDFDWHETHILLKAALPLRASSNEAAFEIPYGVIVRPTTRNNSIEQAKYEVPALRWADLGDGEHGLSLINSSKYGYDATANLLRLSLLRSSLYPDPNADRGRQQFVYSLYPHDGTWQTAMSERRGYEFNYSLTALQEPQHEGTFGTEHSFLQVNDPSIILTAVKKSEDGNALILRAYDWSGKPSEATIQLPGSPMSASEADMMEHAISPILPVADDAVHVRMHPYEIKTLRIEYPAPAAQSATEQ
jgi:alpha-mannosidase